MRYKARDRAGARSMGGGDRMEWRTYRSPVSSRGPGRVGLTRRRPLFGVVALVAALVLLTAVGGAGAAASAGADVGGTGGTRGTYVRADPPAGGTWTHAPLPPGCAGPPPR